MRVATYALPECSMSLPPKDDRLQELRKILHQVLHWCFPFPGAFQGFEVWVSGAGAVETSNRLPKYVALGFPPEVSTESVPWVFHRKVSGIAKFSTKFSIRGCVAVGFRAQVPGGSEGFN